MDLQSPPWRILVLKLDHLGDFIIGLPALAELRAAFPQAVIRLICGPWNQAIAQQSGLADEIRTYTYFPQNARHWDGQPVDSMSRFAAAADGVWDLAIDLRVDEDTRFLLRSVDAARRCGIGSLAAHPFLDIRLPPEHADRMHAPDAEWGEQVVPVEAFTTVMQRRLPGRHESDFSATNRFLVSGPGLALPRGWIRVLFDCDLRGRGFGLRRVTLTFDAYANGSVRAQQRLQGSAVKALAAGPVEVDFENPVDNTCFEFRLHCSGRPLSGRLGFKGCRVRMLGAAVMPRLRRAELHIGEKLSLLVCLVRARTVDLYGTLGIGESAPSGADGSNPALTVGPAPAATIDPWVPTVPRRLGHPSHNPLVLVAPISNSTVRDWPAAYYRELIGLLLDIEGVRIGVLGSAEQTGPIAALLGGLARHERLQNLAGVAPWTSMPARLRAADLVICNNSGVAHLAAAAGAPTLALYSASHEPAEWGPRGADVRVLAQHPPCAPCGHDRLESCRHEHVCMTAMTPPMVFAAAAEMLGLHGLPQVTAMRGIVSVG